MIPKVHRNQVRRRRSNPRRSERVVDPAYLEFLCTLPCWACHRRAYEILGFAIGEFATERQEYGQKTRSEPAHVGLSTSHRGASQKHSDHEAIPLCREHHGPGYKDSIHDINPDPFFALHRAGRDEVIAMFQGLWKEQCR